MATLDLTVLLVSENPALLAGECGGAMPTAYRYEGGPWFLTHAEAMGWHLAEDPRNICIQPEYKALPLVCDGIPVAMGIDRALRLAILAHYARRDVVRARIEERAKAIYATYPGADRHPWIEGGNADAQYDARRDARAEMSGVVLGQDRSLNVLLGPTYTVEAALRAARLYVDTHPGACMVILRDGQEGHDVR